MTSRHDLLWKVLDPFVLRVRSRLEHLSEVSPSTRKLDWLGKVGEIDPTARLWDECVVENAGPRGSLSVGAYSNVKGQIATLTRTAVLRLGHHCYVGPATRIWAQESVTIGDHVLIAHLVDIHDSNSHSLDWRDRRRDAINLFELREAVDWSPIRSAPVVIEDDVWIGFKTSILKGVTIGRGAVVAAGSLVTHDVPAFTLVAGSPARVIRALDPEVRNDDGQIPGFGRMASPTGG